MEIVLRGKPRELAELLPRLTVTDAVPLDAVADKLMREIADSGRYPSRDSPAEDLPAPAVLPHADDGAQEEEVHRRLVELMEERKQAAEPA